MEESFFALLSRMRYIGRWGLMRNNIPENVQEHSCDVAILAHALVMIRCEVFDLHDLDPGEAVVFALFHDATEIITGDLPTPIKYGSAEITSAYQELERLSVARLLSYLPEEFREAYRHILEPERGAPMYNLVKAADKLSAYIKCVQERKTGNIEFCEAERQTLEALRAMDLPELQYFMERFLPAYEHSLDVLGSGAG